MSERRQFRTTCIFKPISLLHRVGWLLTASAVVTHRIRKVTLYFKSLVFGNLLGSNFRKYVVYNIYEIKQPISRDTGRVARVLPREWEISNLTLNRLEKQYFFLLKLASYWGILSKMDTNPLRWIASYSTFRLVVYSSWMATFAIKIHCSIFLTLPYTLNEVFSCRCVWIQQQQLVSRLTLS